MEISQDLAFDIEDLAEEIGLDLCASQVASGDIHIDSIADGRLYIVNDKGIFEAWYKSDLVGKTCQELLKIEMHKGELKEKRTLVVGKKIGKAVSAKQIVDVINDQ